MINIMFAENTSYVTPTAIARRRINATLRGPVLDVLGGLMPELAGLPSGRAFDAILGDCDLLYRCFQTFRIRRTAFRTILVDRRGRPVTNDNQPLDCGRTLNQVIAMVVRSAAKRHFRMRLDPPRQRLNAPGDRFETRPSPGWRGMLERVLTPSSPPPIVSRAASAADLLYEAIKEYLLHDWQVPIIPQYARMTPVEVQEMGSRLLDFRDAAQLAAHLDGGEATRWPVGVEADAAETPVTETAVAAPEATAVDRRARLNDVLTADGSRLGMRAVVPILQTLEIHALVRPASHEAMRELCRTLSATSAGTVRQLAVDFGLPPENLTVVLAAAADTLAPEIYRRLFGIGCDREMARLMIVRARASGLRPDSPPAAFNAFVRRLFAPFKA